MTTFFSPKVIAVNITTQGTGLVPAVAVPVKWIGGARPTVFRISFTRHISLQGMVLRPFILVMPIFAWIRRPIEKIIAILGRLRRKKKFSLQVPIIGQIYHSFELGFVMLAEIRRIFELHVPLTAILRREIELQYIMKGIVEMRYIIEGTITSLPNLIKLVIDLLTVEMLDKEEGES